MLPVERNIDQAEVTEIMEVFQGLERQLRLKLLRQPLEGPGVEVITPVVHAAVLHMVTEGETLGQMLVQVQVQLRKQTQEQGLGEVVMEVVLEVVMEVDNQGVTQTQMLLLPLLRTLRLEPMVELEEMDLEAFDRASEEEKDRLVQAQVLLLVQMLHLVQAAAGVVQVIKGVMVADQEDVVQSRVLELMPPLVLLQLLLPTRSSISLFIYLNDRFI